jgi:hypothetical protein
MINVRPEDAPRLGPWLAAAAKGMAVVPGADGRFHVFVHDGKAGNEVGRIVATCTNELDAELLASALWSLTADVQSGEKCDHAEVVLPHEVAMAWSVRPFIAAYDLRSL